MDTSRTFLPKIRSFFCFQKGLWKPPLFSLLAHLWVWWNTDQYPWISLNIFKKSWIYCSNYARALKNQIILHVRQTLNMLGALNKPGFQIWDGCICKGYPEFRICLVMLSYALIMPEYGLICLNMPKHG